MPQYGGGKNLAKQGNVIVIRPSLLHPSLYVGMSDPLTDYFIGSINSTTRRVIKLAPYGSLVEVSIRLAPSQVYAGYTETTITFT